MRTPLLLRVDGSKPQASALRVAADALRDGALVAFPTETVYGLGAHALDAAAIAALFAAKQRPVDNPLIVHVSDGDAAARLARHLTPLAQQLAERFWPGPLTLVLDAAPVVPRGVTGGLSTVALRVPDHPVALALLRTVALPVAAPSANRSGRPSPTTAEHVVSDLGATVRIVLDGGPCTLGLESTVVDARGTTPVVLRDGAVTREQLGVPADAPPPSAVAASPGTRHRHYAPACEVVVAAAGAGPAIAAALASSGQRVGLVAPKPGPEGVLTLGLVADADALAPVLYDALRAAERAGCDVVVVEAVAEEGVGRAVMDRLRRAAAG